MSHILQIFNLDSDWAEICKKLLFTEKKSIHIALHPNFPGPLPEIKILILRPIYEWYGRVFKYTCLILRWYVDFSLNDVSCLLI